MPAIDRHPILENEAAALHAARARAAGPRGRDPAATEAHAALRTQTESLSVPVVSVVNPKAAPAAQRIELPADVQPYQEASIFRAHQRLSGALVQGHRYPGAGGELLAYIETPEVDAQLEQARADEHTAQAEYDIAKVTADRWSVCSDQRGLARSAEQDVATMKHGRPRWHRCRRTRSG